ncbi:PilZ domain-containing protein [Sphingomonas panacisoli]|uniref:PilZ domain-containing protein n=1 Tax=Sphingomonas panacisoli TaxID=1813879 RepID=A0A5B8LH93_9SPHN|nr:PilZ domain-containing protein [Sphingomonas panacisoli]QDZ07657.1 PilZ domain-containing protein [Sphingomonas panacisoli]
MGATALAYTEKREVPRDEVDYRARAYGADAQPLSLQVVNMSAQGLMARITGDRPVGERMRITLPIVGVIGMEVRWSLGGRIGCELDRPIGMADYYELLAALLKGIR